jgi:hypothetical protein
VDLTGILLKKDCCFDDGSWLPEFHPSIQRKDLEKIGFLPLYPVPNECTESNFDITWWIGTWYC